jgi:hypothetical protein
VAQGETPKLNADQLKAANELLDRIRKDIETLAKGSPDLAFAYRRKLGTQLVWDERGKPAKRKRLKAAMFKLQEGKCAEGGEPLAMKGSVLDRKIPMLGYTKENVDLICTAHDEERKARNRVVVNR